MSKKKGLGQSIFGYLLIPVYYLGLAGTSSFLLFQVILTLWKQKVLGEPKHQPYFKSRSIFPGDEPPLISRKNWQTDRFPQKVDYAKVNEGFGGAYERIAYTNILKRLAADYGVASVLELNSTYIAGVPAFNSCLLAQAGYKVTLTVHERDYPDAVHAWKLVGLADRVKIVKWNDDFKTPFRKGEFDLVWNHLAVEHYKDPLPLVKEMKRVAKKLVVTMTLSPWNLGFMGHWLWHKIVRKEWDHGYIKNTLISTMEKVHSRAGLKLVESGGCDDPTSPDTVDGKLGGSMTYLDSMPEFVRRQWEWSSINPVYQKHFLVRFYWFLETHYPEWFRRFTAHHLYTASRLA